MKKVIVIANQKGGVGKTTTAVAITAILNKSGYKTILIDADPSMYSTDSMKGKTDGATTLYDVILNDEDKRPLEEAIQKTENGYIIASDPYLMKADSVCATDPTGLFRLSDAIEEAMNKGALDEFSYIVIDTPPELNTLLSNCLVAADEVIIPTFADRYAVKGLYTLTEVIMRVQKKLNPKLKIMGLLLTKYNERQRLSRSIRDYLVRVAEDMGTVLLSTPIRETVATQEAQAKRKTLIDYKKGCTTEKDYEDFVDKYIEEISFI